MLRVKDIAQMQGVSEQQVYKLIREHRLPATRLGRAIYIPASAWAQWYEERTVEALAFVQR